MILNINDDFTVEDASHSQIKKCIGKLKDDCFAVLEQDEENFLQVYIDEDMAESVIEYRDGATGQHFQAPLEEGMTRENLVTTFQLYLSGNQKFQEGYKWMQVVFEEYDEDEEMEEDE